MRVLATAVTVLGLICLMVMGYSCKSTDAAPAAAKAVTAAGDKLLFDFENNAEVKAWKVEDELKDKVELSASDKNATSGKRSLKMVLKAHQWPGAFTKELPKDWSGYSKLVFDVVADQAADMNVRIDDANSTDYESRFQLGGQSLNKGKNEITVWLTDVGAAIDLKKITAVFLFCGGVEKDLTFYIDNIRLIKKK